MITPIKPKSPTLGSAAAPVTTPPSPEKKEALDKAAQDIKEGLKSSTVYKPALEFPPLERGASAIEIVEKWWAARLADAPPPSQLAFTEHCATHWGELADKLKGR